MDIPFSKIDSPFVTPSNAHCGFNVATLLCYHQTMNYARERGQLPNIGKGCGNLPTTFEDATIVVMFDYDIQNSITRDVLAMEEEETPRGHLTLWAL